MSIPYDDLLEGAIRLLLPDPIPSTYCPVLHTATMGTSAITVQQESEITYDEFGFVHLADHTVILDAVRSTAQEGEVSSTNYIDECTKFTPSMVVESNGIGR